MNKNWIKENWFKIGLIAVILVLSWVIYQAFVTGKSGPSLSQKSTSTGDILKLSMQCREDGNAKFQEDKNMATSEKYKDDVVNCYYIEPNFVFNQKLNTCLYYGGYTCDLKSNHTDGFLKGSPNVRWMKHIVDIYTNKTIDSVYVDTSEKVYDWLTKQINDFNSKAEELGF